MGSGPLRIGIIGAGQVAKSRHIPGFRALSGVKIEGVCNLRRESSNRVARELDIPRIFKSWEELVEDDAIDAVVVSAWPYLHCPVTLAALDAGKHVLTQARMAMNAREAQRMYDKSREHQELTAMIVPSPYGLEGDAYVRSLIEGGYLGELREVHVTGFSSTLADPSTPLSWRQMTKYSGFNMLNLGILYESVLRWVAPATRVSASASKLIPSRPDAETGKMHRVGTPDSVQVLTGQDDGSIGIYRLSAVVRHAEEMSVILFGSEGTLCYDFADDTIRGCRSGQSRLAPLPIPPIFAADGVLSPNSFGPFAG